MDDNLIQFLNNFPLGTALAVLFGFCALVGSGYLLYKKFRAALKEKILAEEENTSYKTSINDLKTSLSNLESKIDNYVDTQERERQEIQDKLENLSIALEDEHKQSTHADELLQDYIHQNADMVIDIRKKLDIMNKKTNLLIDSDKEMIKAAITEKYYESIKQGYIEIHTLQSLESQYEKYLEEHGNTFIGGLMRELRTLPHQPPEDKE